MIAARSWSRSLRLGPRSWRRPAPRGSGRRLGCRRCCRRRYGRGSWRSSRRGGGSRPGPDFFCPDRCIYRFLLRARLAASCHGGAMATQLEGVARVGGSTHRAVTLTPQARRLLEGPVLTTLLRLAAPTVALMLLQG